MKHLILSLGLSLGVAASAAAQGPWSSVTYPGTVGAFGSTQLQLPTASAVWLMRYTNTQQGTGHYDVYLSTNEGQSWQGQRVGSVGRSGVSTYFGERVLDVWTLDAQNAWIVVQDAATNATALKRTTTGPTGFQPVSTSGFTFSRVRFFTSTVGVAFGTSTAGPAAAWPLLRTTDGGTTWTPVAPNEVRGSGEALLQPSILANHLSVPTTQGRVLHSADAGLTWSVGNTGLGADPILSIAFRDANHGLALGKSGALRRTSDGGLTWSAVNVSGPLRTGGLAAMPGTAATYLSYGHGSNFGPTPPGALQGAAISTDDGLTWQSLESSIWHEAVVAASPARAWAVSYSQGQLYRAGSFVLPVRSAQVARQEYVYPNPTTGTVQVPQGTKTATVYDAVGRQQGRYNLATGQTQLKLEALKTGLYQLVLQDAAGASYQQRIQLER